MLLETGDLESSVELTHTKLPGVSLLAWQKKVYVGMDVRVNG